MAMLKDLQGTASNVKDQISGTLADAGRNVRDRINDARGPAAEQLRNAAGAVSDFSSGAADSVQAVAGYVRENDVKTMLADLKDFVRRHPGQSLIAAIAAGFLIGRGMRSGD